MHWSPGEGLHALDSDEHAGKTDVFKMDHGGRSSMSTTEENHAVNGWVVRMKAGDDRIMRKVRTGVPVPFPLIGRETEQIIQAITVQRLRETIALMLLESKGHTQEFQDAVDNPNQAIDFNAIHTSLLSPDKVRKALNSFAEKLPKNSKLRGIIKKKLDNEMAMHKYLQEAIRELSAAPTTIQFHDEEGHDISLR